MKKIKLVLRVFSPALLLLVGVPAPARAQATAIVRGTVLDPTGATIPAAQVEMWNPLHPKHRLQTESQPDGSFVFYQVPFNPYRLTVAQDGFRTHQENLEVHTATLTLEVVLEVGAVAEEIEVTALLSETMISTHVSLDEHELVRKPGAAPSRMIETAMLESAGVTQNANSRLHVRGAHYQVSFMIDGLPISDQLSIDFGNPFDVRNVEALEVYTGNFPAEFGNKVSGVVNVSTKSGLGGDDMFHGSVGGALGSFDTGEGSVDIGGGNERFGYYLSVAGGRSHRFLDPPSLDNLNNGNDNQNLFLRFDFSPKKNDFLHFMVSGARSRFDVPNLPSQHLAGQSQEQRLKDVSVRFTWLHVFEDPRWSLEAIPYYRTAVAQLFESPFDTPVTASQARHLTTTGVKSAVSYTNGHHRFKAGIDFFAFPVSEILSFGITDPDFNVPPDPNDPDPANDEFNPNLEDHDLTRGGSLFLFDDKNTGKEYSFFVQDNITYGNVTASLGIRYDNYNFVLARDHWSPRVGLAYRIEATGTVVRGSYNRLWQTPSNENLLVSTSEEAAGLVPPDRILQLGTVLLIVEPERVNFYEVGAQQSIRDWFRMDGALFWKRIRNFHDNDQFFNTTIVFPTAISKGRVKGFDFRIDMPQRRGLSAYWNLTVGKAIAEPPLSGGLFIGEEAVEVLEAGPFRIDHDQTYSSQGNLTYEHESGVWSALTIRFDSGLPVEIEDLDEVRADPDVNRELELVDLTRDPFRVDSRTIWDWSIGFEYPHEKPRVSFQFDILNLTDETALFNFLSVFSGTHVIRPRAFSGRVRYFF